MAKEDWLLKEINRLAQLLAKLLRFKLAGEDSAIIQEVNESLNGLALGLDDDSLTAKEVAEKLIGQFQTPVQASSSSEIFKEKALAQKRLGLTSEAKKSFEVALCLAIWADESEGVYSSQNQENIEFLREKLN